jgi:cytochrome o ubiquinol oxidase operon protein cyoD
MNRLTNTGGEQGNLGAYINGYVFSLFLTIAAYLMVTHHLFSNHVLVGVVVALALAQFVVQLVFFLHLGRETKPRWKLFVLLFMVMIVLILVFGSLWIMDNLNYRMTPAQIDQYMKSQDAL